MSADTFIFKERNSPHGVVMIVTDPDIIGKIFETENLQLDLTKEFYQGTEKTKEEVKEKLQKAYLVHFTGKHSVALGVELDIIDADKILVIQDVPHAEVWLG